MTNQIAIKNIGRLLVIEPYSNSRLDPGESKSFDRNVAQRFLVLQPEVIRIVTGIQETTVASVPVEPMSATKEETTVSAATETEKEEKTQ